MITKVVPQGSQFQLYHEGARKFNLLRPLLGGSWVVISRVISPLSWVISIVTLIISPFITTHEPPSIFGGRGRAP